MRFLRRFGWMVVLALVVGAVLFYWRDGTIRREWAVMTGRTRPASAVILLSRELTPLILPGVTEIVEPIASPDLKLVSDVPAPEPLGINAVGNLSHY